MDYRVIRDHEGDKWYRVGDIRVADPRDVAHLIGKCLADPDEAQRLADEATAIKAAEEAEAQRLADEASKDGSRKK